MPAAGPPPGSLLSALPPPQPPAAAPSGPLARLSHSMHQRAASYGSMLAVGGGGAAGDTPSSRPVRGALASYTGSSSNAHTPSVGSAGDNTSAMLARDSAVQGGLGQPAAHGPPPRRAHAQRATQQQHSNGTMALPDSPSTPRLSHGVQLQHRCVWVRRGGGRFAPG